MFCSAFGSVDTVGVLNDGSSVEEALKASGAFASALFLHAVGKYCGEERERQYTDRNKYDCGYHSSQQIKCSFRELNKIIDSSSNADGVTKLNTSYDNFVKKLLDLNVIKNCDNKSKNYGLLKLYMLFKKIKNRRDVVRSIKSNDKYGFDFFKMLNSIDIENFVFDDLPYRPQMVNTV